MDIYLLSFVVIGAAALAMAWLPIWFKKVPFSYAMLFVVVGYGLYKLPLGFPEPDPLRENDLTLRLSELCVIITLMGTGIKINRSVSWASWQVPLRLVSWTMLLCIGALAWLAWQFLGFSVASAVLLAAAMAPTDPVLASDVQVGPPSQEVEDAPRFSLTAEAGLNDSMAFPFTWLAIALATYGLAPENWLVHWLWYDLLYRIGAGVAMGYLLGKALAYLLFRLPKKVGSFKTEDGFVAISATLLVYGLTEMVHGYGFIAVFITGLTLKNYEKDHSYHRELHDFTDQIERILVVIVLIVLGGSIARGLLDALTWPGIAVGVAFVFVVRPLAGFVSLFGVSLKTPEKWAISFFGIRGIGSIFYVAFALSKASFMDPQEIWAVAGFIILLSIFVHGFLASPVMQYLDRTRTPGEFVDPALTPLEIQEREEVAAAAAAARKE
ncbi:cation:proton antiporter [Rufibacter glacialis]|uniref:Cation:proton antiporter n=1 Tax=Rufibacter glacialis TaxID=1259555 RepID=A0A5M8QE67_9BACT|nr:cation:proton antiporter [Rufibacter glacialis]KAA6433293.1 sodium:proton antiporter [Rufibacter glacialis]GGK75699.1 cation transporter [Rufibacter glacialis]